MSVQGKLVADAVSLGNENGSRSVQGDNFPNCFKVMEQLGLEELKSVSFLLMGFIDTDEYFSLMLLSKSELYTNLRIILQQNSKTSCFGEQLILEILGTMKKFKLLKSLGVCKHNFLEMKRKQSHIKPLWRLLYNICDNLDNNEVQKVKACFSINNSFTYAEDVFCYLYHSKRINETENFSELVQVLTNIERLDLVQDITSYIEATAEKHIEVYDIRDPTRNNPCGLAVIVNLRKFESTPIQDLEDQLPVLENRDGSQYDKDKLLKLWTNFGFKTEIHDNLSAAGILSLFSNLQHRGDQDFDIFVACLLSHGDKDVIYGSNCRPVKIDSIIDVVDKCSFLKGKPKLFFIQACQGHKHQKGVRLSRNNSSLVTDAVPVHSGMTTYGRHVEHSDMYKAVAVIEGFVSYRSPSSGSLFITKLVENLESFGDKWDLEFIMKKVKALTAEPPVKQMPITSGTLRKSVIFKKLTT